MARKKDSAALKDDSPFSEDGDHLSDCHGATIVELPSWSGPPRDEGLPSSFRCGDCGQEIRHGGTICPGCDAPMHDGCGAPVGDDEYSPFRLCASCQSSHHAPSRSKANSLLQDSRSPPAGLRKPSRSPTRVLENGRKNIISELMKPASSEEFEGLLLEDNNNLKSSVEYQVPDKIGLLGSDHFVFLVYVFVAGMVVSVVYASFSGGFHLSPRSTTNSPPGPSTSHTAAIAEEPSSRLAAYQDAWWMELTSDDYLRRYYLEKEMNSKLTGLRDVTFASESLHSPMCGRYRFSTSNLPKASIVVGPVYAGYPKGLISMTIHSLLARTPPELIQEIVVIRGYLTSEDEDDDLEWELEEIAHLSPNSIKVSTATTLQGPASARVPIIRKETTGEIIIVMDAHVEVWSSTWLQHLMLPVLEFPRTISAPLLYEMKQDKSLLKEADPSSYLLRMNKKFELERVTSTFDQANNELPSSWKHFSTPFFEGPMFAVHRDQYFRLNEMDKGMGRFKGSNLEMSFKFWQCRGRVVHVPCAKVGYIPISSQPLPPIPKQVRDIFGLTYPGDYMFYGEKADEEIIVAVRNYLRIARVWFRDHAVKGLFYDQAFGSAVNLPAEWKQFEFSMDDDDAGIDREEQARDDNQCQDFEWYDRHVLMSTVGSHNPWFMNKGAKPTYRF